MAKGYIIVKGIKRVGRNLKKIDKRIKGPVRKEMLDDVGKRGLWYARQIISHNMRSISGHLLAGMHYRVFPTRLSIWNDAGDMAYSWERGMRPHWIHRDMLTESGYTVGEWMGTNKKYIYVGTGKIGKGIGFISRTTDYLRDSYMPKILSKYGKRIVR